jgi:UDP-N-acetylmuramate-alanine ligase
MISNKQYKHILHLAKLKKKLKNKCVDCGKILSRRDAKRCRKCYSKLQSKYLLNQWRKQSFKLTKRKIKNSVHKHHIDLNHKNNEKDNTLYLLPKKHCKLHANAYRYLVEIGFIRKYLKWFDKNFKLEIQKCP